MILIAKILLFVLAPMILIRWSRWLATLQQKEYRWDRLWLFLMSREGRQDLIRVLPNRRNFSRAGLKRPAVTRRIVFVGFIGFVILIAGFVVPFSSSAPKLLASLVVFHLILPIIVSVSILPSQIVSEIITLAVLMKARKMIKKHSPTVVGITGSYGKTSTKLIISHVLRTKLKVFTTPKSYNKRYSVAKSIVGNYRGQQVIVLEYGAYRKGEIRALAKFIKPSSAVITGLTPQHMGIFGSLENIIAAKSELIKALADKSRVFYNGDDPGTKEICEVGGVENPIAYSGKDSTIKISNVGLNNEGQLKFKWEGRLVQTRLVGTHYIGAVRAALVIGQNEFGFTNEEIIDALESFDPGDNFILTRRLTNGAFVIDDGKTANPAGFKAALEILKFLKEKRGAKKALLVFGGIVDLGGESAKIHSDLSAAAHAVADEVAYVGSEGQDEFLETFHEDLFFGHSAVEKKLKDLSGDTIVLVEGFVPKSIYETYLQ